MKLYTRIGDDGSTRLFGNIRIGKDDPRVEAYGCVDELNSAIGLAMAACKSNVIHQVLYLVQNRLFDMGADLASPAPGKDAPDASAVAIRRIGAQDAAEFERLIDQACAPLAPMKCFILPGGSELSARLHLARAICRRAERACVALSRQEEGVAAVIIALNRLSDLLFALARRANQLENIEDVPWRKT